MLHYTIYYCILGNNKRPIDQSRIVKTGRKWSKLVKTGNDLPRSKANETFIWTFWNLIFLLYDHSHYGLYSIFYASLIILNISYNNFSEGVPATVLRMLQLCICFRNSDPNQVKNVKTSNMYFGANLFLITMCHGTLSLAKLSLVSPFYV